MLLSYLNYFLMESYCLPLISYSCEALNYNRQQLQKQEAQLMLRNSRDRMFYVNRASAYLVPFSR